MESSTPRSFAIVFVLGAPGAGRGTLCMRLAQNYNLVHYSVGDSLRNWMRENHNTPLAVTIQDKLDNQGFLTSEELNAFMSHAIKDALAQKPHKAGILVDGFPRSIEQLNTWSMWPFSQDLPIVDAPNFNAKPDIILSLYASKLNAKARYSARARDSNDSDEKFERRFAEYERETIPVEESYRQRDILIDIDVNGSKEENITEMTRNLSESELWQKVIVKRRTDTQFLDLQ